MQGGQARPLRAVTKWATDRSVIELQVGVSAGMVVKIFTIKTAGNDLLILPGNYEPQCIDLLLTISNQRYRRIGNWVSLVE